MDAMNQSEIKQLIDFLVEKDIAEFELEQGELKMRVKRGRETQYIAAPQVAFTPAAQNPASAAPVIAHAAVTASTPEPSAHPSAPAVQEEEALHIVRSPIVGTFYEAPSPGAPAFVKLGDTVKAGQPLCIVEAMKLMNEIEADASGEIAKMYVSNAQPVEYGQPLFGIKVR